MPPSLQNDDLNPRQTAYDKLAQLATDLELSYTATGNQFIITLPQANERKIDVVAKIDVPEEEE